MYVMINKDTPKISLKVAGMRVNRPDTENIATELGVSLNSVIVENNVLIVFITSEECKGIVADGALTQFVAMALEIPAENVAVIEA